MNSKSKWGLTNKVIARTAIFGAITTILYAVPLFQFKIAIFPSFLDFHFDEIPVFIAGYAYGPLVAILVLIIKTLIKLPFSSTAMVGEFADLLFSLVFIIPAVLIYKKNKTIKGVMIGFFVGFGLQLVVSSLSNALFMIDYYIFFFDISEQILLGGAQATNPLITDVHWTMVLYGILPFNIIKNLLVIVLTFLSYKRVHTLISRF
jgi:riboflavin transporter FmnP